jgi:predicted alpha/beta-hydrolase family hydrolase
MRARFGLLVIGLLRLAAPLLLLATPLLLPAGPLAGGEGEEVRTIPARRGVTESFLLVRPAGAPVASVIIFAGGDGNVAMTSAGIGQLQGNFLVRTRQRWAREGFLVAVLDQPSDRKSGLWNFRTTAEHAADVKEAIAAMRELARVPVWLVGTSMGSLSAANAAARLSEGGPDGIVLTSSVTETSRMSYETTRHAGLADIRVPTLVVHHKEDTCRASPFSGAEDILKALKQAPAKELMAFEGGSPAISQPCEAKAAHGYLGIEAKVVSAIGAWIRAH